MTLHPSRDGRHIAIARTAISRHTAQLIVALSALCPAPGCDDGAAQNHMAADASSAGDADSATTQAAADSSAPKQDPSTITTTQIHAGDFVFDARVAGPDEGELVVLLHGFPETSYEWRAQLGVLGAAGFRAVAPDQRGYSPGARPSAVGDYSVPLLAQDVVAIADALGAERFHVVGHDWGASVAWALGSIAKERLVSLTALSVPHPDAFAMELRDERSCQHGASSYIDFFITDSSQDVLLADDASVLRNVYGSLDDTVIAEYLNVLGEHDALRAALNWYRANFKTGELEAPELGSIATPTLFIWSDGDTALCREGAEHTERYVTGPYQFEILEGVDHWLVDRAPDRVNELLLAHLERFRER